MEVNGNAALHAIKELQALDAGVPDAAERLRAIARQYGTDIVFTECNRPESSIEPLSEKARELGLTDDPEIRAAIEAISQIPPMGW